VFEPDSDAVFVVLIVAFPGLICCTIFARNLAVRLLAVRLLAAFLAFLPAGLFGAAAVNLASRWRPEVVFPGLLAAAAPTSALVAGSPLALAERGLNILTRIIRAPEPRLFPGSGCCPAVSNTTSSG